MYNPYKLTQDEVQGTVVRPNLVTTHGEFFNFNSKLFSQFQYICHICNGNRALFMNEAENLIIEVFGFEIERKD